ncbi:alpha/beta hydrolase [Sphingobacterium sp. LRF_L2]|uniref:alpha/beta hydrolase n=1 Tax=Sphingobacterium sp. LRF_L2 TaxID=3369421 RepID=UPI003F60F938
MAQKIGFQITVHIINKNLEFIGTPCYLAGSFNNWSVDGFFLGEIPPVGEVLTAVLPPVDAGTLELKLTRGSWDTVQSGADGKLPGAFTVEVDRDMDITLEVEAWRDQFSLSTASKQVHLLDERFYFPHLDRYRRIWLYLPADYEKGAATYPVLYMHDGQHLFDEATSVGRAGPVEWMVDETIDASRDQSIVVGIEHAPTYAERQEEFLMHSDAAVVRGEAYLKDLVFILKPHIDAHFRTKSDRLHTAMVGSSLGGLITLYAGFRYPDVFGSLGVFSPSIWIEKDFLLLEARGKLKDWKRREDLPWFYLYIGAKERRSDRSTGVQDMLADVTTFADLLIEEDKVTAHVDIDPEGKHGALSWQKAFKRFYNCWQKEIN